MILVMDHGQLIQRGSPANLIAIDGKFKELCAAGGTEEFEHLKALAEQR